MTNLISPQAVQQYPGIGISLVEISTNTDAIEPSINFPVSKSPLEGHLGLSNREYFHPLGGKVFRTYPTKT